MVAAALAAERKADYVVRTGTVNAGHTVWYGHKPYKMQQLPTSWATQPKATMVIGPGAYVMPEILARELAMIREVTLEYPSIIVDHHAGLHLPDHTYRSSVSGRHHKMGATGKGCSEAVVDKIKLRGSGQTLLFSQWMQANYTRYPELQGITFADTSRILNEVYAGGGQILIEGTQGSHLDLHLGPYPYTTHKQTQAVQWVGEAGLGVGLEYEVIMVARTYPIRVAGNSGPMPEEITWPELAREIRGKLRTTPDSDHPAWVSEGAIVQWEQACASFADRYRMTKYEALNQHRLTPMDRERLAEGLSELHKDAFTSLPGPTQKELRKLFEFTTVTNKLRRVAKWRSGVVQQAIEWNGGIRPNWTGGKMKLCVSFWNYVWPSQWGATEEGKFAAEERVMLDQIERDLRIPVHYITTGPETQHFINIRG